MTSTAACQLQTSRVAARGWDVSPESSPLTEQQTARQTDGDGHKTDNDGCICSYPDCFHYFDGIRCGSVQFSGCFIGKVQGGDLLPKQKDKINSIRREQYQTKTDYLTSILQSVLLSISLKVQHSQFTAEFNNMT